MQIQAVVRPSAHQRRKQQNWMEVDPNRLVLRLCTAVQNKSGSGEGGLDGEGKRLREREKGEGGDREKWQEVESDAEQSSCDILLCALSLAGGVSSLFPIPPRTFNK